ncbi:FlgD immunoglobulin-like domain containing protein [Fibrobacterota bacterium]
MRYFIKAKISMLLLFGIYSFTVYASSSLFKSPSSVFSNGIFSTEQNRILNPEKRSSENGRFICTYKAGTGGSETRELKSFEFFEDGTLLFSLSEIPGSDISISNAGYVIFYDHEPTVKASLTIHCYSKNGKKIFSKGFNSACLFGFSPKGNMFGVGSKTGLEVISLSTGEADVYRKGWKFDISMDETVVAVAYENGITVYSNGKVINEINTGMVYTRKVRISPDNKRIAVIGKRNLRVYSSLDGKLTFSDALTGNNSFRDMRLDNTIVWTGIHYKGKEFSKGILRTYNLSSNSVTEEIKATEPRIRSGLDIKKFKEKYSFHQRDGRYPIIPWPFSPQDEAHELWNAYEGLNTPSDGHIDSDYPYLHQGIDMECDRNTRIYAVMDGIVKCVLTLGGDIYWRCAHAEEQVSGYSDGWLYAHVIESSFQIDVGDTVENGDYLGQIVYWSPQVDGHIHFSRITDHGAVWSYDDDEWGITYNPELSLTPNPDSTAPVIVTGISGKSKFGYCGNNTGYNATSSSYYDPDSAGGGLTGDIDIVVKLYDYIGYTNFTQPAFSVYYWIKGIDPVNCWSNYNKLIVDTTLGHIRNHTYDFYNAGDYKPYSEVLYKADNVFVVGGWFNRTRRFAHCLTNTNGDSLITTGEKDSCLHTDDYYDGWYRVYVKAYDCKGNFVVDSEDVYFNNGNHDPTPVVSAPEKPIPGFYLGQNFPSRFSSYTTIHYHVPKTANVSLTVYDLAGNEIKTLVSGIHKRKKYAVTWDGVDNKGREVGSGIYLYRLQAGRFTAAKKTQLLR